MNQTAPAERTARRRQPIVGRLDRYIIYKFLSTYIFLITIIVVIAVVFDFNERIDKLTQSHAPVQKIIFDYYVNFVPNFVNLFTPLFVFIAVIFFTSKLADNSEIIAMKSTGMSFRRLLRPYMISAALIAASSFLLGAFVIPQSNVARVNFENRYIKKKTDVTSVDNVQMQVDTGVVAYITHFDNVSKSGYGFSLDKFVDKNSCRTLQHKAYSTIRCRTAVSRGHCAITKFVHSKECAKNWKAAKNSTPSLSWNPATSSMCADSRKP